MGLEPFRSRSERRVRVSRGTRSRSERRVLACLEWQVLDTVWTRDPALAEKVAAAVLEWAKDHGATMYTHCFQPLGSGMVRLGQMGQVHNAMFNFDRKTGGLKYEFDSDILLQGACAQDA